MTKLSERTMGQWLEHWAQTSPDKECIVYADRNLRWTWKSFNERVDLMAKGLMALGIQPGMKIGIWAANVPDWLTLLYASAKIGAIYVTINTNYKQIELEYICKNSDLDMLCIVRGEKDSNFVEMVYEMLPELKTKPRGESRNPTFPHLRHVLFLGEMSQRGMYNTRELLQLGKQFPDASYQDLKSTITCQDVVNMQYTSGTTGFPKGVMLTHHNIVNNGYLTGENMGFTAEDKLCCCVPLFHCFGIVLGAINCLTHGCTLVMLERFDPLLVLCSIHKERCTVLYGVPTMFIAELRHPFFDIFDLSSLRTGVMGGALCPVELMREVEEKMYMKITSVYGLTEASPSMTAARIADNFETRCTTVGRAFEHTEVKVIDPETHQECPTGVQGEICCRGYNVMKGYYKDEKATRLAIDTNGFLHSGDLGIVDENGNYHVTGRIKDMIIRGGENIYPKEVEEYIYTHAKVEDVQIVGLPSPKYGEVVAAFVIAKKGEDLQPSDVREYCKNRIARFKIPKYVFIIDQFPMTGSGKIQKFKLKEWGIEYCAQKGITIV